jgi:hypothetical protein
MATAVTVAAGERAAQAGRDTLDGRPPGPGRPPPGQDGPP